MWVSRCCIGFVGYFDTPVSSESSVQPWTWDGFKKSSRSKEICLSLAAIKTDTGVALKSHLGWPFFSHYWADQARLQDTVLPVWL